MHGMMMKFDTNLPRSMSQRYQDGLHQKITFQQTLHAKFALCNEVFRVRKRFPVPTNITVYRQLIIV